MENTVFNTSQHKKIITTLTKGGSFAISDIEKGNSVSREQIGKILKKLIDNKSLVKNRKVGSGVKYKLTTNTAGITFLLINIDQATIEDIANAWNVSVASAKKYIKKFVDDGVIEKIGKPPKKINYSLAIKDSFLNYPAEYKEIINKYYSYLTPEGRLLKGVRGFEHQILKQFGRENIDKMAEKYIETRREYYGENLEMTKIDVTNILKYVFKEEIYLERMFYSDFDKLPIFNETRLMQLIRVAKAGQKNTELMVKIISNIEEVIKNIIEEYNIEAIAFIPPTVMRKTQLMTFLQRRLNINIPQIKLEKAKNLLPIQQISLKSIQDRIKNAKQTIQIKRFEQYESVLLVDDVVGSGATLNETAKQLINKDIAQKVYGFAAVGPINPGKFEIIPE